MKNVLKISEFRLYLAPFPHGKNSLISVLIQSNIDKNLVKQNALKLDAK